MIQELKPCPFCGETASIEQYGDPRQSTIYQCDSCSCRLETGEEWDHGKLWNRRPDLSTNEERAAQFREAQDIARATAIDDVLNALTAHELYQYRPKAFSGFIEYARTLKDESNALLWRSDASPATAEGIEP
jgi:Lar family restriction alleviation protein